MICSRPAAPATGRPEEFLWLHLNLAHAACERWMQAHLDLPEEFFSLYEGSRSTCTAHVDSALLAVVNDVVFNFSSMVSSDISTLWVCACSRLLISAMLHKPPQLWWMETALR